MLIIVVFDGIDIVPYKTDIVVIKPVETVDFIKLLRVYCN